MDESHTRVVFDLGEANGSWCCEQFRDTSAFRAE